MDDVVKEFQAHEEECRRMADLTRNHEQKTTWAQMADRWRRCAENAKREARTAEQLTRQRAGRQRTGQVVGRPKKAA